MAGHFLREFARLTGQPTAPAADPTVQRVLKRLAVVQSLLALAETDDLPKHLERLEAEGLPDPRLGLVLAALRAHRYAEATERLAAFVAAYAQVRVWEDPRLAALQLEIRRFEAEILALTAEQAEAGRLLTAFEQWHERELGELLREVLALRRDLAAHERHASAFAEAEFQRAEGRYRQHEEQRQQTQATAAHTFALDAEGRASLKKLYREAAQLCHPDRVAPSQQAAAMVAFLAVQAAYQRQDVAGLQTYLAELRQGRFTAPPAPTTADALAARRDQLAAHHVTLLRELVELRAAEAYQLAQAADEARAAYLHTNRAALQAERDRLRARLVPAVAAG